MKTTWSREDLPYDAMGDYSVFDFTVEIKEDKKCADQDRSKAEHKELK